jgi:hypothetical protein
MSRFKLFAFIALITLAFGVTIVGDALAGEKYKIRGVFYTIKWETINVPGEEKHLLALVDSRGVLTNLEGKPFGDGMVVQSVGLLDIDLKSESGFGNWYEEYTDRDGDKICTKSEGRRVKGQYWGSSWEGMVTIVKGTGKYEGIQGRAKWSYYNPAKMQTVVNAEWEVDLPR